jgi:hypothetical protein
MNYLLPVAIFNNPICSGSEPISMYYIIISYIWLCTFVILSYSLYEWFYINMQSGSHSKHVYWDSEPSDIFKWFTLFHSSKYKTYLLCHFYIVIFSFYFSLHQVRIIFSWCLSFSNNFLHSSQIIQSTIVVIQLLLRQVLDQVLV